MALMRYFLALCVTVLTVIAVPTIEDYVVHEKRSGTPSRWVKRDRVPREKYLPIRVGLSQRELHNSEAHLMSVSDPRSAQYGQHWTKDQVIDAFRPSPETESQVRQWLMNSGIPLERITHSENKAWFAFYASAAEAESLLRTEFYEYEDTQTNGVMPSCEHYHLPKNLTKHIDYVTPGIRLLAPPDSFASQQANVKRDLEPRMAHGILRPDESNANALASANDLSTCDQIITPACVAALYNISATSSSAPHPNNSMGIFESKLQFWTQVDLDSFFKRYTNIPNGTFPIPANIDGGQQSSEDLHYASGEASIDLMLAYPIIYPQTVTEYNVDDFINQALQNNTYTFGFNTFLDALDGSYCTYSAYNATGNDPSIDPVYPNPLVGGWSGQLECGTHVPTNVISLSYGGQEVDLPLSYQRRQCLEYLKLGLQGVSFFFASGDSGVSNYPAQYAQGTPGCLGPNQDIFSPTWPTNCPWVTAVGATKVYPGYTVYDNESAANNPASDPSGISFSSGGGFSNVYPAPDYQKAAIATYLNDYNPGYPSYSALAPNTSDIRQKLDIANLVGSTGGLYNRIGRGQPDVSAVGDNIAIYLRGEFTMGGGTSASTPVFAAVINRINEERLNAGKGPVGFVNPALYQNPSMLNDITNGSNPGCNTIGFPAAPGWDPVTGLGTPNYPKMLDYFMSLP